MVQLRDVFLYRFIPVRREKTSGLRITSGPSDGSSLYAGKRRVGVASPADRAGFIPVRREKAYCETLRVSGRDGSSLYTGKRSPAAPPVRRIHRFIPVRREQIYRRWLFLPLRPVHPCTQGKGALNLGIDAINGGSSLYAGKRKETLEETLGRIWLFLTILLSLLSNFLSFSCSLRIPLEETQKHPYRSFDKPSMRTDKPNAPILPSNPLRQDRS